MQMTFTRREKSALNRLLADVASDIILKTDREGRIVHASPGIECLDMAWPKAPAAPHIHDLAQPAYAAALASLHDEAMRGGEAGDWVEFPIRSDARRERWFEIQFRALADERGAIYGGIGVLRSIEERRALEEQLFAAAMTDPLTQLTNRTAFIAMLRHMVQQGGTGCLALFSIDHLKAINMKHGQAAGDAALVAFADVLRGRCRSQDTISRIGGESLGVLLSGASVDQAEAVCRRIIAELGKVRDIAGAGAMAITGSAGVATIGISADDTLKRAEMALFFAKSKGRNRLEIDGRNRPSPSLSAKPS